MKNSVFSLIGRSQGYAEIPFCGRFRGFPCRFRTKKAEIHAEKRIIQF